MRLQITDLFGCGYASAMKAQRPASFDQRWTAWGTAIGGGGNAKGDPVAGSTDVALRTHGFGGGVDYHFGESVVGFAAAGGGTTWSLSQSLGTGRSDVFLAGAYGRTLVRPTWRAPCRLPIIGHTPIAWPSAAII